MVVTKFLKNIFVYQDSRTSSLYCNILPSPFTVAGFKEYIQYRLQIYHYYFIFHNDVFYGKK